MANIISDETIEYVGILAKLELSETEKEEAKKDMGRMLDRPQGQVCAPEGYGAQFCRHCGRQGR